MTPRRLGTFNPAELRPLLQAARAREEKAWWRTAWAVAHLINVSGKVVKGRGVSAGQLLGKIVGRSES